MLTCSSELGSEEHVSTRRDAARDGGSEIADAVVANIGSFDQSRQVPAHYRSAHEWSSGPRLGPADMAPMNPAEM